MHYRALNSIELNAYHLHSELIKRCTDLCVTDFIDNVNIVVERKAINKYIKVRAKLNELKNKQIKRRHKRIENIKPEYIQDFVINKSDCQFDEDEMELLNKGLKFALPPDGNQIEELVVDIASSLNFIESENNIKDQMEIETRGVLAGAIAAGKFKKNNNKLRNRLRNTIKKIKDKDIYITKADKSNNVVIQNKRDYDQTAIEYLNNGDYEVLSKNPVKVIINEVNATLKSLEDTFGKGISKDLRVKNPMLARFYCLPKTHKPGNKVRPICSNIGHPTEKIAKWLVSEFTRMGLPRGFSVKNTKEFIDKMDGVTFKRNEVGVSFDVESLYPSTPVDIAINEIKAWLTTKDLTNNATEGYVRLVKLCMNRNEFVFRGKYYKQKTGTAMGNSLSGVIANFFMNKFENEMKLNPLFPRVWTRYVDDIYAVVNKRKITKILEMLNNSKYPSIRFTHENENENQELPFLDLMIGRGENGKLTYSIYRKPTSTKRSITCDSYHHYSHKMANFHHMIHRLLTTPLSEEAHNTELNTIYEIARINGYDRNTVTRILNKHKRKQYLHRMSSLFEQNDQLEKSEEEEIQRFSIAFNSDVFHELQSIFRRNNTDLVPSNRNNLKNHICSVKDKISKYSKSGVYQIKCLDCDHKYIGQTWREIGIRYDEHMRHYRYRRLNESAVSKHLIENSHQTDYSQLSLIKHVQRKSTLDAWESLMIHKQRNGNLMNGDSGPLKSKLFELVI